ncbi:MAG: SpoIIE family protein phosphatase [Actinomycetota bacterium]|nr:SpoIIE family protein phosphatase [Actinomycetota bacterium]
MSEPKPRELVVDGHQGSSLPATLLRAVFEHTNDAVIIFDPDAHRIIEANPRALSLTGYSKEELLDLPLSSLLPNDATALLEFGNSVFDAGRERTTAVTLRPKAGNDVKLQVSAWTGEVGGRRCVVALLTEEAGEQLAQARGERRFQMMVERSFDGILLLNRYGTILYASRSNELLLGYTEDDLIGTHFLDHVSPYEREQTMRAFAGVVEVSGETRSLRLRIRHKDGSWRWVEVSFSNLLAELSVGAVLVNLRDIAQLKAEEEEQKQSERVSRERAAVAEERYRFLLRASTMLSSALDSASVLDVLAQAAVPALGDMCIVDMSDEERERVKRVAVHGMEEVRPVVERLKGSDPAATEEHPAVRVMRSGEPELITEVSGRLLDAISADDETRTMLEDLEIGACLSVPIVARWSLGALTLLVRRGEERRFGEPTLDLAQDLARRGALALDNARLFEASNHLAYTLQKSLLPAAIPRIAGAEIAARYHAAGEGNQVGGDFYDLFQTGDDDWAAVIGDVCGKGAEAAALTALARHTIRAAKMQLRKPRRILAFLNEVVLQSRHQERFMTAAYCRLQLRSDGIRVTISRAGHPAPLVLRRDGTVTSEGRRGSLLGILAEPDLWDRALELRPGDALLLYTDGVIDARGVEGRFGQPRLVSTFERCKGMGAEAIADRIEDEVLSFQVGKLRDDMAIVVIKVPEELAA